MKSNLALVLAAAALVLALLGSMSATGGGSVIDGPLTVNGRLTIHDPDQVSLCFDSDNNSTYGDDCLQSSAGGGFYFAVGGSVHALDTSGHLFSIPGKTPELAGLFVEDTVQGHGPPILYRSDYGGNICIWAGAASNSGLMVYMQRPFYPGWKNGSFTDSVTAQPGTLRPAFVTWTDRDPLDGRIDGIITDALGVAEYDRCYTVTVWVMADPPP